MNDNANFSREISGRIFQKSLHYAHGVHTYCTKRPLVIIAYVIEDIARYSAYHSGEKAGYNNKSLLKKDILTIVEGQSFGLLWGVLRNHYL